eukprot:CAMPEP_0197853448 /NCGR_PEP_ID=MMETSP1438-20131217/22748_1 /TAXON_ID=1461541 /ORGANISM="Pterosperma sp., Strain CCMP1384" /LENGTH=217 /DNA_ID=CAMNT_0043467861 /DNA_START=261 /DNA_END=911 /DNA_ORIENTATION=+
MSAFPARIPNGISKSPQTCKRREPNSYTFLNTGRSYRSAACATPCRDILKGNVYGALYNVYSSATTTTEDSGMSRLRLTCPPAQPTTRVHRLPTTQCHASTPAPSSASSGSYPSTSVWKQSQPSRSSRDPHCSSFQSYSISTITSTSPAVQTRIGNGDLEHRSLAPGACGRGLDVRRRRSVVVRSSGKRVGCSDTEGSDTGPGGGERRGEKQKMCAQ